MSTTKSLPRLGEAVETVCLVMALLSLAGGVICAVQFGKTAEVGYGGSLRVVTSGPAVAGWLAAGAGSAIMWWVLGRIGTALRWLEAMGDGASGLGSFSPDASKPLQEGLVIEKVISDEQLVVPPAPAKPRPNPKTPEQLAKEAAELRRSAVLVGVIVVALAVAFFFLVQDRLQ